MKVKITKCYLIQILDDNDNEVKSEVEKMRKLKIIKGGEIHL